MHLYGRKASNAKEWNMIDMIKQLETQPGYWRGRAMTRRQMAEQATDGHEQSAHLAAAAEFERRAGV